MIDRLRARAGQFLAEDAVFGRVLKNSSWLLSANFVTMILAFVQGLIIARVFGPQQLGIVALVTVYASTVNQFVDSRVWEAAIKYIVQYREQGDRARAAATVKLCYIVDALTGGIAFAIVYVTAGIAARILVKEIDVTGLIQFYAVSVVLGIPAGTSGALLRISGQFNRLAYQDVGTAVVRLAAVIVVAVLGLGIKGLLVVYLLTTATGAFTLLYMSRDATRRLDLSAWWRTPLGALSGDFRRIFSFMFHTNLSGTSRLVTSKADTLILGWLGTASDVGLYKLARTLADPLNALVGPAYSAVYPALSNLVAHGEYHRVRSLQLKLSRTIAAVIFPACAVFTVGAIWAIPAFFGREFQGAVPLAQITLWQVIWTPVMWVPGLLLSMERARTLAGINWLDAGVYIVLLLMLVAPFGAMGAAIATLLRFVAVTTMLVLVAGHANRQLQLRASLT